MIGSAPESGLRFPLVHRAEAIGWIWGIRALLIFVGFSGGSARARPVIRLRAASARRIVVECRAPAPKTVYVAFAGKTCAVVEAAGAMHLRRRGYPELPFYMTRVVVPAAGRVAVVPVQADYREIVCPPPLPSAGFASRGSRHRPVRRFGPFYEGHAEFPRRAARIGARWNIHGVSGVTLGFYPYRYDPDRRVLRYCTRMVVELRLPRTVRSRIHRRYSRPFYCLLQRSVLNPAALRDAMPAADGGSTGARSGVDPRDIVDSPSENGTLLLIGPADFLAAMSDFITWKRQRGLRVETAVYPADTGAGAASLKAFVQNRYDSEDLDFVILVGDAGQVPVATMTDVDDSGIPSDTVLSLTSGDDYYQDLLVSRISADSAAEVRNQAAKFLRYERNPLLGDDAGGWLARGTCIASDQGGASSAFGKDDYEILTEERQKWLDYGYGQVDELFDPGVLAADITQALNRGRGLVYYLGHGSTTAWNTGNFDVSDAYALDNGAQTPFVVAGACHIGDFNLASGDCLAEAFMKAGSETAPAGAVGIVASTTAMDWDPPIVMLQACTGYLTEQGSFDAGGMQFTNDAMPGSAGLVTVLAVQRAMDYCYGTPDEGEAPAEKIMEQTHLFGDCSLGLRTRAPGVLQVTHAGLVASGESFPVTVTSSQGGVAGATVCLYRAPDVQAVAVTDAAGKAVLTVDVDPGDPLTLTVYHRQYIPYQAQVQVGGGALRIYSAADLPVGFVGEDYRFAVLATGGTPPYAWSVTTPSTFPAWLSLNPATGVLSGVPDAPGTFSFTVQVADSASRTTVAQELVLTVGRAVRFTAADLPDGEVDQQYTAALPVAGDFPPFSYSLVAGTLPPGVDLDAGGALRGTPTAAGAFQFSVRVRDSQDREDTRQYTVSVAASPTVVIVTETLPAAEIGEPYTRALEVHGGTGTGFTWSLVSGALPPGMGLSGGGEISGTPTASGTFPFTARVADDARPPHTAERAYTITVNVPVRFTGTSLPAAYVGVPYHAQLPVEGTYTPITVSAVDTVQYRDETASSNTFALTGTDRGWAEDEQEWPLDLPFAFPYYDQAYTSVRVGDDGYLVMGDHPGPSTMWDAEEANLRSYVMIAPFWNDLVMGAQFPETGIFVESSSNSITIRWCGREYDHQDDPSWNLNFSVTLTPDGCMRFAYGSLKTTNRVVIGISDGAGSAVVLFTQDKAFPEDPPAGAAFWNQHEDEVVTRLAPLPAWLSLSPSGLLSGTPPVAGDVSFGVTAADQAGNTAAAVMRLPVVDTQGFLLDPVEGWNCISLPVNPTDPAPSAVFPDAAGGVWRWDAAEQTYRPAVEIRAKEGYWVFCREDPDPYFVPGSPPVDATVDGAAGWNLIGPLAVRNIPDLPDIIGYVWGWRDGHYEVMKELEPGYGYWLYLDHPAVIDLDAR